MDELSGGSDRPLTRRELRALDAERERRAEEESDAASSAGAHEETEGPDRADPAGPSAAATTGGTTWSDDVRWSLHGELPRALPPEPEIDDVRWDLPPVGEAGGPPTAGIDWGWPTEDAAQETAEPEAPAPGEPATSVDEGPGAGPPAGTGDLPRTPTRVSAWPVAGDLAALPEPAPPAEDAGPDWFRWESAERPAEEPPGAAADEPPEPPPTPAEDLPAPAEGLPAPAEDLPGEGPAPTERGPAAAADADDVPGEPEAAPAAPTGAEPLPTLSDLLAARPELPAGPAESGWQGTLRRITGGLLALSPGPAEQRHRASVASVQRSLDGPRTIVVINPKGGAHKTTASLLLAATFGQHRGGYTLAWDNNETRGTLGWRAHQTTHHNTAVNLLQDLERFSDAGSARVGDLDNYVRSQGSAQFDVLASDEDAASAASIDGFAFRALHRTLARFYRVMVVDTGNNMRASNWQAAIEAADQVVIVSTVREDTAQSAAWAIDALRATGHGDAVGKAVTVLSDPAPRRDPELAARLHEHFGKLTRAVLDVPYDASLVGGTPLEVDRLDRRTREPGCTSPRRSPRGSDRTGTGVATGPGHCRMAP